MITITPLIGTMELDPVKYWVEPRMERTPWLGRPRTVFYLCSEFGNLGPFNDEHQLRATATQAGIAIQ